MQFSVMLGGFVFILVILQGNSVILEEISVNLNFISLSRGQDSALVISACCKEAV